MSHVCLSVGYLIMCLGADVFDLSCSPFIELRGYIIDWYGSLHLGSLWPVFLEVFFLFLFIPLHSRTCILHTSERSRRLFLFYFFILFSVCPLDEIISVDWSSSLLILSSVSLICCRAPLMTFHLFHLFFAISISLYLPNPNFVWFLSLY